MKLLFAIFYLLTFNINIICSRYVRTNITISCTYIPTKHISLTYLYNILCMAIPPIRTYYVDSLLVRYVNHEHCTHSHASYKSIKHFREGNYICLENPYKFPQTSIKIKKKEFLIH